MRILTNVNVDWLRWRWHALVLSWVLILAGVAVIATRGLPLGIDFSGGTLVVVRFQQPVTEDAIRNAIAGNEEIVQRYGDAANEFRSGCRSSRGRRTRSSSRPAAQLVQQLRAANLGTFEVLSTRFRRPVIGRDLQRRGVYATLASLVGIADLHRAAVPAPVSAPARWSPACTTC